MTAARFWYIEVWRAGQWRYVAKAYCTLAELRAHFPRAAIDVGNGLVRA